MKLIDGTTSITTPSKTKMKNKLIDFLRLTLPSVLIVVSTSAIAFKQGGVVGLRSAENHQSITSIALLAGQPVQLLNGSQIRFTSNAALEVMNENAATDGYFTHFKDPDFHFDADSFDLSSRNLVALGSSIAMQAKVGNYEDARKKLGTALHMVQDFYAHSNWVERKLIDPSLPLPNLGKPNPFADPKLSIAALATCDHSGLLPGAALTFGWFDIRMALAINDIGSSTSDWNGVPILPLESPLGWPNDKCIHGGDTGSGLNKDQLGRPNYQVAYINAIQGSRMFLNEVVAILKLPGQGGDRAICGLLGQEGTSECGAVVPSLAIDLTPAAINALSGSGVGSFAYESAALSGRNRPAAKFTEGYLRVPNSSAMQFTDGATFDLWARIDSNTGMNGNGALSNSGWYMTLLAKSHDRNGVGFLAGSPSPTRNIGYGWVGAASFDPSWASNQCQTFPSIANVQLGVWFRMSIAVSTSRGMQQYVNKQLVYSCPDSRSSFAQMNTQDLFIGRFSDNFWYPLNGAVSDIRIYQKALTASEVTALP